MFRVEGVWPLFAFCNQSRSNGVRANLCRFLNRAFIMPQSMIEKVPLPIDLGDSRDDPFKIADEIGKSGIARNAN
jgi:hypothetical protein